MVLSLKVSKKFNLMSNYGKTLLNGLTNTKIFSNKEEGVRILKEIGLEENIRAEKLSLQDFANISNELMK